MIYCLWLISDILDDQSQIFWLINARYFEWSMPDILNDQCQIFWMINAGYFELSISDNVYDQCQIFRMINVRYFVWSMPDILNYQSQVWKPSLPSSCPLAIPTCPGWLYPLAQVTSPAKVHKKLASYATNHPNTIGKKFFVLGTGVFLTYVPMFQINFRSFALKISKNKSIFFPKNRQTTQNHSNHHLWKLKLLLLDRWPSWVLCSQQWASPWSDILEPAIHTCEMIVMVMMLSARVRCHNDCDDDGDGDGAIRTCEMMVMVMVLSTRVRCNNVGDGDIIMMVMVPSAHVRCIDAMKIITYWDI